MFFKCCYCYCYYYIAGKTVRLFTALERKSQGLIGKINEDINFSCHSLELWQHFNLLSFKGLSIPIEVITHLQKALNNNFKTTF